VNKKQSLLQVTGINIEGETGRLKKQSYGKKKVERAVSQETQKDILLGENP